MLSASSALPNRGTAPPLPSPSILCTTGTGAELAGRGGTSRRAVGTAGTVSSGRGRGARPLPRAGCALAPQSPWPPASQPFPGNLIAAADEPKMHFLPPCCNFFYFFFINVRRETQCCQGGGQRGLRWRSWGWGTWGRCPRGGQEGAGRPPGTHTEVNRDQAGVTLKFRIPALPEHHGPTLPPLASLPGEGWGLGTGLALGCLLHVPLVPCPCPGAMRPWGQGTLPCSSAAPGCAELEGTCRETEARVGTCPSATGELHP